jgi:hypothetical protein
MPLEPFQGVSLSSRLLTNSLTNKPRTILDSPRAAGSRLSMLALFGVGWLGIGSAVLGQQQPPPPQTQTTIPAPAEPTPQQTPAPTSAPPEIAPDDPDNGEPLSIYYWKTSGPAHLLPGTVAAAPNEQLLTLPNFRSYSPGGQVSIPAGKFNHVELSYFQAAGAGDFTTPIALSLFGSDFGPGTLMSTAYTVRNAQLDWNYLNWPAPPEDSKFRIRTLYGFNYTRVSATIDAPLDLSTTFTPGVGSKQIFYPDFGIVTEYIPSKHLFIEVRAWGFGFPQHADIGDAEANIVAHVGHMEIFGGYKIFHFKTQKKTDQYFLGTISGPTVGLRWVFR